MASKIIYVLMSMAILNVALLLFSCTAWDIDTGECVGSLVSSGNTNSTFWSLVENPSTVGGDFWDKLFGSGWGLLAAVGVTVGAILVGTTIFGKNIETTIYIAIGLGLASVVYPSIKLWQMLNGWSLITNSTVRLALAIVIVSTMVITVMFTVIDWARGRD